MLFTRAINHQNLRFFMDKEQVWIMVFGAIANLNNKYNFIETSQSIDYTNSTSCAF